MISVIVCDDSALMRDVLSRALNGDPDIEVVAMAGDPYEARDKIKTHNADVLTLDVEMPRMDGITFLENIMRLRPMPVVMVSSLTAKGANVSLDALQVGAFDAVLKPKNLEAEYDAFAQRLRTVVKAAATANVQPPATSSRASSRLGASSSVDVAPGDAGPQGRPAGKLGLATPARAHQDHGQALDRASTPGAHGRSVIAGTAGLTSGADCVFAIGASTGGVDAVTALLSVFPPTAPPTFIVQHMPATFTAAFADRLDRRCAVRVREAVNGAVVGPGEVVIAPGGRHLVVERTAAGWVSLVREGETVNGHCPSVDVLFQSLVKAPPSRMAAAVLTGMGDDGAQGLLALKRAGAKTFAQCEQSCLIYGMPRAAKALGGVDREDTPHHIAQHMLASLAVQPGTVV